MIYFLSPHISEYDVEAAARSSSVKDGLEFRKTHRKTLVALQTGAATLLKKRLWHRYFPVNFAKFLGTPFSQSTSGRLLLNKQKTKKNLTLLTRAVVFLKLLDLSYSHQIRKD